MISNNHGPVRPQLYNQELEKRTFFPGAVLHVRVAGHHHNLHHQAVAPLPDHVDDLPVTNLHHILTVDLRSYKK